MTDLFLLGTFSSPQITSHSIFFEMYPLKIELLIFSHEFLKNFIYLFYFWLCCIFVAAYGLSLVVASGGYSSLWCAGFSLQWLLSVVEHGL